MIELVACARVPALQGGAIGSAEGADHEVVAAAREPQLVLRDAGAEQHAVGGKVGVGVGDEVAAAAASDEIGICSLSASQQIIARTAVENVVAAAAAEGVGSAIADNRVVPAIAGAIDDSGAGEDQILDVSAEGAGDGALHRVDALVRLLCDEIAGVVHDVGVVAGAADHPVVGGAAIEQIVAGPAIEIVAVALAQQPVVAGAAVDGVVAAAAAQGVVAGAAGDDVVERVAGAGEIAGADIGQALDVGGERVGGDAGLHLIGALARQFDDDVAGVVHGVGVVAGAARQAIAAGATGQQVIARGPGLHHVGHADGNGRGGTEAVLVGDRDGERMRGLGFEIDGSAGLDADLV